MNEKLFNKISEEKRTKIIIAAMEEFSEYGFELCSTNRIVKKAEISKGSLFKYFKTKEELYFFLIDRIVEMLSSKNLELSDDLFDRIRQYAKFEFDFYLENPLEYTFIKRAFLNIQSEIKEKTLKKYSDISQDMFIQICDDKSFKLKHKNEFLNILKWTVSGFNDAFMEENRDCSPQKMKEKYLNQLEIYLTLLKNCLEVL